MEDEMPDVTVGATVKIHRSLYCVKGTDPGTLWVVLTIERATAWCAMLGDSVIAEVPVKALIVATTKELANYVDQNWSFIDRFNVDWVKTA